MAAGMSAKREAGVTPLVRPFELLAVPFLATVAAMLTVGGREGLCRELGSRHVETESKVLATD